MSRAEIQLSREAIAAAALAIADAEGFQAVSMRRVA
jgi:AcrR family transcriptional regulator